MIKRIDLFGWELKFVLRHRWDKSMDSLDRMDWNTWGIGIWYKKYRVIRKPNHNQAILGVGAKLVNQHMLGINLLWCKFWFTICYRPFNIEFE